MKKTLYIHISLLLMAFLPGMLNTAHAQYLNQGFYYQGEDLFKNKQYYAAAQCYEKYLVTEKRSRPRAEPFSIEKKRKGKTNVNPHEEAIYKLAECYRLINDYVKAEKYYQQALTFPKDTYPIAEYWYGVCLRANQKYPEALAAISKFLEKHTEMDEWLTGADRELENLKFIQAQGDRIKDKFTIIPQRDSFASYALTVENEDAFVYTAVYSEKNKEGKQLFYNGLYESKDLDSPVRSSSRILQLDQKGQHSGMASFSRDGRKMFFTRWTKFNGKTTSAIYISSKTDTGWSLPVKALDPINVEGFNSTQPFITEDGNYLLFASDRPGGSGGYDLWYASIDTALNPIRVENMGNVINSEADEEAPFFHSASRVLVFSTNGRIGMGGFDLFYAKGNFNFSNWDKPQNAGAPLNSSKDDLYYISTDADNLWNSGWVSSDRASDCCLALFSVKQNNSQFVSGSVIDCITLKPLDSVQLTVTDLRHKDRILGKYKTDSAGHYQFEMHNSTHFNITAERTGFVSKTKDYGIQVLTGSDTLSNDAVCLQPVVKVNPEDELKKKLEVLSEPRSSTVGNFDYKKAILHNDSYDNLDSIAALMKDNPSVSILVEGYTDGIGGVAYNLRLAQRRVDACIKYLVKKGVAKERLFGKAFGKCCPIAPETIDGKDNPEGREKNRRVEYKLLPHQ